MDATDAPLGCAAPHPSGHRYAERHYAERHYEGRRHGRNRPETSRLSGRHRGRRPTDDLIHPDGHLVGNRWRNCWVGEGASA